MALNSVLFPCKISRGAFSSERVFEFDLQNGEQYMSVADRHYCMDYNKKTLPKETPDENQCIEGYIQAYELSSNGDATYITIPDGEVVPVNAKDIIEKAVSA